MVCASRIVLITNIASARTRSAKTAAAFSPTTFRATLPRSFSPQYTADATKLKSTPSNANFAQHILLTHLHALIHPNHALRARIRRSRRRRVKTVWRFSVRQTLRLCLHFFRARESRATLSWTHCRGLQTRAHRQYRDGSEMSEGERYGQKQRLHRILRAMAPTSEVLHAYVEMAQ